MPGRRRRVTGYMSAAKRKTKNVQTRRAKIAVIHRDFRKLTQADKSKRFDKH